MSFITREQVETEYSQNQRLKSPTDIGFTWIEAKGKVGVFNYQELKEQVEVWIKDPRNKCYDYNNRKVETPDGKEWWVCVLQVCLPDGELDQEKNPMGSMSLMLFGVMVAGYTYAFENETLRDWVFEAISQRKPMPPRLFGKAGKEMYQRTQDLKPKPTCCLCGELCDCPYGHNPFPLAEDGKCCSACNSSKVIPARMKGIISTQILKNDTEAKEHFQEDCMKCVKKQLNAYEAQLKAENPEWGRFLTSFHSNLEFSPAMTAVKETFEANQQAVSTLRTRVLEVADRYVGERIGRHIRCRSITSVEDICLTTSTLVAQEYHEVKDLFLKWVLLQREFYDAEEEERKRIADQLAEETTPSETSTASRSSADEEKERTRKANKAKQSKAQQKAEFERREIECAKIRAEQERKDKEKKRIAKAKKEKAKREAEGK
jgi:hypothetical protein